jgi:hypothetical protein
VVTVVPERGLQLRTVNRRLVSQIDPRDLSESPQDTRRAAVRPGALAFRTLQGGWLLDLAIDKLDPWITAQVRHDVTLREGQRLNVANLTYRIENAAVKALRVRLPGLDQAAAATLRATGQAVADLVPVAGEEGLWEIRFERGVAGETKLELAWQSVTEGEAAGLVESIRLEEIRQVSYLMAVRAGGRLEVSPETLPRGWQRVDWSTTSKQYSGDVSTPALAFRVADPDGPLRLTIKRHELADLRRIRVSEGELTTLLSSRGTSLTAVRFQLELNSKSTLRLRLPDDSRMFHAMVNGEAASLVREGGDWLCLVSPSPDPSRPAELRFVYASPLAKGSALLGPMPDAPMENLRWNVLLPDGWRMKSHRGDFDLIGRSSLNSYSFDDYRSVSTATKESESKAAVAMLDQAGRWLEAGDQKRAGEAFSNVANNGFLDAASGEDARVQLRALKTQQAVLGLNTRRQRMVMENRISETQTDGNEQFDHAMQTNPVFDGAYNFDPRQFNRFLEGNTSDENSALKEIANRIVNQQLATEAASATLDVTLPEAGRVVKFSRSVQLSTDKPMRLELVMVRDRDQSSWLALPLCLLAAVMTVFKRGKPVASSIP